MKKILPLIFFAVCLCAATGYCQLYKVELPNKVKASSLIAEGRVIAQKSFWNDAHTMIFTANTIQVYKTFKGRLQGRTVEILTQGGSVDNRSVDVSDLLTLNKNQLGVFFCHPNTVNLASPNTGKLLYDVYSSDQGFFRYDIASNKAYAPFAEYNDIEGQFYGAITQLTGEAATVVDPSFSVAQLVKQQQQPHFTNGIQGGVASFSPLVVHGGTLNDPANNTLTITGSGFGDTPSGLCAVNFKDGNSNSTLPDYSVPYTSQYFVSWSDTKIVVKVPTRAATGALAVVLSDGTQLKASQDLTVTFSVLNFQFNFSPTKDTIVISEPRLMSANNNGGYTYQFSTSTLGSGRNMATDAASATFNRAIATWRQTTGANLVLGSNTTLQAIKDDNINVVQYDNKNTGVPAMADGVLEVTYSWGSTCYATSPSFFVANAQKTGFDILIRNPGVSTGSNVTFEKGPCFPDVFANSYDLESIMLHEIGHALNLSHVNDSYEQNPLNSIHINPGKIMHYAIINYGNRRSPDNSAYTGVLYTVTPQSNVYGVCLSTSGEMSQLAYTVVSNDECPNSFPTLPTPPGTVVNFDLVHATSNKFKDPAFTQVNCQNTGEFVTNNAYYALKTTALSNGTLSIKISNYTTTPAELATCADQGVRLAVYNVSSCPDGQNFPSPVSCATFTGNGTLADITGLLPNQTYLLYFDGLRNTKATFSATLGGSALPVTLSKFTGEYIKGVDKLYIDIVQALNVKTIAIEKSANAVNFSQLGVLQVAQAALIGHHTYIDAQPFAGNNFYRLKIVNNDGSAQYSSVIRLQNADGPRAYVYPNPVKSMVQVALSGLAAGRYNFGVYDLSGRAVVNNTYAVSDGNQSISIPVQGIAKGVYIIKIANASGLVITQQKLVKE